MGIQAEFNAIQKRFLKDLYALFSVFRSNKLVLKKQVFMFKWHPISEIFMFLNRKAICE